jgi:putative heme-binding domain-containing protein
MHKFSKYCFKGTLFVAAILSAELFTRVGLGQNQTAAVAAPRPIVVWPSGPLDVIAAFDGAVDPVAATALVGKSIPYYEPSGPGADRLAPSSPSGSLRIVAARLSDAGRTLTLATDPHSRPARYMLPLLPGQRDRTATGSAAGETTFSLCGVTVTLTESPDDRVLWSSWWPFLDLEATRTLTRGSKRHESELALLSRSGRLVLDTLLRLPSGRAMVRIESSQPIEEATLDGVEAAITKPTVPNEPHWALLSATSQGDPLFLSLKVPTGANGRPVSLKATYRMADDKTDHAIERDQLILPWATLPSPAATAPVLVPDLAGGDAARGRTIFTGEQARCALCHSFRGQGGKVGPDLTEIGKKGRAEIYRAIAAPSASIEPDYISYSVETKKGQVFVGVVRAEGADAIRVTDTNARATTIPLEDIERIGASANSIMPVGLTGALGDATIRDLIAFLTDSLPPPPGATSRQIKSEAPSRPR